MEKFSVLMSLYDKESPDYLSLSLKSIFEQTIIPDQVVLVLDGQINEKLMLVVDSYKEKYHSLEIYPLETNQGLSAALNIGLDKCCNEIVFRMDTDDICVSNRFELTLQEYDNNPELEIVGSFATMVDESGLVIKNMTVPTSQEDIYRKVWTCPFIHPTVSFKKSSIVRIGGYNPNSGPRQDDYELWFRAVEHGIRCKNINKPLLYYRFFKDSISKNTLKVGWWRAKVGIKGAARCKCSVIAYFGVCYPLIRALMPLCVRKWLYNLSDYINPRTT